MITSLALRPRLWLLFLLLPLLLNTPRQVHAATLEDGALSLNQNGHVEIPHHPELNPTDAITIEAWVWRDGSNCETVLGKNYTQSYWLGFCTGTMRFYPGGGGAFDAATIIPTRTWTHVAVTYDGSTIRYYINGESDGSLATTVGLTTNDSPLGIGADPETGFRFDGFIDEVRLWDRVRTQAEIQADMRRQIGSGAAGLVGYWRLNGSARDLAWGGHGADGTLRGSATYTPRAVLPNDTAVTLTTTAVTLDGDCTPTEYAAGWLEVSGFATTYLQHDDDNVYICFAGLEQGGPGYGAAVLFDTDDSRTNPAGSGDYRFHIDNTGATTAQEGNGSGGFTTISPPAGAWEAVAQSNGEFTWDAEFRIARGLLQIPETWRANLGVALIEERGNNPDFSWPGAAIQNQPATWGRAYASAGGGSTRTYTINGLVFDDQTGDPIAGSTVQLFGSTPGGTLLLETAVTNSSGAFAFSYETGIPTTFIVQQVDKIGFSSVAATVGDDAHVITPNAVRLDAFNEDHSYSTITFLDNLGRPLPRTFDQHYLIVYNPPVTYADLWPLIEMKRLQGFRVTAETVSNIEATTAGYDRAEKIRNWLRAYWQTHDPHPIYALLIGDPDVIPERQVGWEGDGAHRDPETSPAFVTDWYYADLDSDAWDRDGDGYYGEFLYCAPGARNVPVVGADLPGTCPAAGSPLREGGYGADPGPEDDWIAEISIGRIMLNESAEVRAALENIVATEASGDLAKRDALFAGALWSFNGSGWDGDSYNVGAGPQLSGAWPDDGLPPFGDDAAVPLETQVRPAITPYINSIFTLYEGISPNDDPNLTPTASSFNLPLSADNLDDTLESQDYGLVNTAGHGSPSGVYHASWVRDYNDNGRIENPINPDDADGCESNCRELTGDRLFLDAAAPAPQTVAPVYFANACSTGDWIAGKDAIPSRLFAAGKTAGWMGALSIVPVHGVDTFQRDFNEDILGEPLRLGDAAWNVNATRHRTRWVYDWRTGTLQLFGDPAYSYWGNPADALAFWPQFGNDWWATGHTLHDGPRSGVLSWTYDNYSPRSAPVVDRDGTILVGAQNRLVKLNPRGEEIDSAGAGVIFPYQPAITTDGVYAATGSTLYVYDPDLTLRDTISLGGLVNGAPRVGPDGSVWVPTSLGMARVTGAGLPEIMAGGAALSPVAFTPGGGAVWVNDNGLVGWTMNRNGLQVAVPEAIPGVNLTAPTVDSAGTVFVGGDNGFIYAVAPFPFSEPMRWTYDAGSPIVGKPAVSPDGTVYVGTADGRVHALSNDGMLLWRTTLGTAVSAAPALDNQHLYVPAGSTLYALELGSGAVSWSVDVQGATDGRSTPAIAAGVVYLTRSDGVTVAVGSYGLIQPPTDIIALPGPNLPGTLEISWSDNSDDETGFNIDICEINGVCIQWGTVGENTTQTTLYQLPSNVNLYVRVQAVGELGAPAAASGAGFNSDYGYSDVVVVLPAPPVAPAGLEGKPAAADAASLTWSFADAAGAALTGFNIYRSENGAGPFVHVGSTSAGTTAFQDSGLAADETYYYRVTAVNAGGESTHAAATATTLAETLPSPTDVTAVQNNKDNSLTLSWSDNAATETGYVLRRKLEGEGAFSVLAELPANATRYDIPYYLLTEGSSEYEVAAISDTAVSPPGFTTHAYAVSGEHTIFLPTVIR